MSTTSCGLSAAPLRVTFINPATPANAFWEKLTDCMRYAAEDFGMELSVVYLESEEVTSRFAYVQAAQKVVDQPVPPDYVIFVNLKDSGHRMLALFEQAHLPSLIINSDIHPEDAALVGEPRGKFSRWLGHLSPDDVQAGRELTQALLAEAHRQHHDKPSILAINGATNGTAASKREEGLRSVLADQTANLQYHVNSRTWRREDGAKIATNLLKRFPETQIIWSGSDGLALGALDASVKLNKRPAIGGIDWTDQGLEAVRDGRLAASVGGHVLEGIIALTLIYDYAQNKDFAPLTGTQISTTMMAATPENIQTLQQRLAPDHLRRDDFKRLSRVGHADAEDYDFSIPNLLGLLPAQTGSRE